MGNPVAHSLSPRIHHSFAEQCGIELLYQAIYVELDGFAKALDEFQKQGGKGLNITLPFKQQAFDSVGISSEKAARAGAVNTIWFTEDGTRHGDTTDGLGLLRDLQRHQLCLQGKALLVLGAGGAVRSVLGDLISAQPQQITIANRSLERAEDLVSIFSDFPGIKAVEFPQLRGCQYDVVINGTSAGLQDESLALPDDLLKKHACCYDMIYAKEDTPFVSWGKRNGAQLALDGLGMLVEQAAESFYLWHGVRPETELVLRELRIKN